MVLPHHICRGILNYYTFDRTPFYENMNVAPFAIAGLVWSEIGLNFAMERYTNQGALHIGANLKFLNGYEGFYFKNLQHTDIAQLPDDSIRYLNTSVEFGLTISNTKIGDFELERNGGGIALDLGAVYTIDRDEENYLWKIGFSLLDIGKIKFKNNAEVHRIEDSAVDAIVTSAYNGFDDVQDYVRLLSEQTLESSRASFVRNGFGIWLPSAMSVQADYSITPNLFVNGVLVQRLAFGHARLERGNMLALSPRIEGRWLGGALPLVLYNWRHFRLGASVRLGFLTIGSDNIGSIIGASEFTGSDIYFALKINPFDLGWSVDGWSPTGGKKVKCYEF